MCCYHRSLNGNYLPLQKLSLLKKYKMVSTIQIKPSAILQPFISCYSLRSFNTGDFTMPKPYHAIKESYLTFFLKGNSCFLTDDSGRKINNFSNALCNLFTHSNGCTWYKGEYLLLSVQLTANGIPSIFGISQSELIDSVLPAADILGNDNKNLTEQLSGYDSIFQMGALLDSYFVKKLSQQKTNYYTNILAHIANNISQKNGLVSIDSIAYEYNMSVRTLERRFIDQVGMPVKLYARIAKFHHAVEDKMLHPEKNWTAITHENGYYDQSHFIKDCKEFSSRSPEELFKTTPVPKENIMEFET
jgi:AraC-like DNA-binding protein